MLKAEFFPGDPQGERLCTAGIKNRRGFSFRRGHWYRALFTVWAVLLLALSPAAGVSQAASADPTVIGVLWTDPRTGQTNEYLARKLDGNGEAYWAYLPAEAFSGQLRLRIYDYSGAAGAFQPGDGELLEGAADAGSGMENAPFVSIACLDTEGNVLSVKTLYLSSAAELPAESVGESTSVRISFRDAVTGMELYESREMECPPSSQVPVYAQPISGYTVDGEGVQYVTTDAAGNAVPAEVVFTYTPEKQAVLTVLFLDEEGEPLLAPEQIICPLNEVTEVTAREVDGYRVEGEGTVRVYVDQNGGMSQTEAVFRYVRVKEPVVTVYCIDGSQGTEIAPAGQGKCPLGGSAVISAPEMAGYRLTGEAQQTVYADLTGNVSPASVTFTYLPVQDAQITVRFLDAENGTDLSAPINQTCEPGSRVEFYAPPISGYLAPDSSVQTVTVDEGGVPDRAEVVFYYIRVTAPAVTVRYLDAGTLQALAPEETRTCEVGTVTVIEALPVEGYLVQGDASIPVTVDGNGVPDRNEVLFQYLPISDPVVTVRYLTSGVLQQEILPPESVSCPMGETTVIRAKKIDGYLVDGEDKAEVVVGIHGQTDTDTVVFYYSTVPAPMVVVRYRLEDGTEIAEPDQITCPVNQETLISAENVAGYASAGDTVKTVSVDVNGIPDANEIVFLYRRIDDAVVTVRYIDAQSNLEIRASSQAVCHIGANTAVEAAEIEGYTVTGQAVKYVFVDQYGKADTSEIIFTYEKNKAPGAVLVPVSYRDADTGMDIYTTHELFETDSINYVGPDRSVFPETYELVDAGEQQVVVSTGGVPDPAEIVFLLRERARIEIPIPVYYRTPEGEEVASPTWFDCVPGNNAVMANPVDLKENYSLLGGDTIYITMETDGTLSAGEAVFLYYLSVTPSPTPAPTQIPYDVEEQDFFAHPSRDGTYFRSSPDTTSLSNVLGELPADEVVHVSGLVRNDRGEYWYMVEAAGTQGFMNANVILPMSQEEVNLVFGYTPTPVPTEIPDGAAIERWGQVNSRQVALRAKPATDGKIIDRIDSPTKLWVFQSVTENNTQWYQVRCGGTDGYMMKKFVTLLGETESLQYQASLTTPMATKTPPATRMPTSVVTPSPTPGPTVTVNITESPTPVPTATYSGYALTRGVTYLYSGQSTSADTVVSVESAEQLLLIQSQTNVQGVCWDSVEVVSSGRMGFAMDSDLLHINNTMASNYLNSIPSSEPTAVPTDVPAQYNGYGITIGDHAVIRAYADTNAQIYNVLEMGTVVMVTGQEYSEGQAWEIVNYGSQWGYIRSDQIRMLNTLEVEGYLATLRTPTPLPQATPTAVAFGGSSLSSYGYVTASRVNLRSEATQSSSSIRMLEQYAFALVMETIQNEKGEVWYHVSQAGTDGYIRSDYFTVMTLDELSAFLTGDNYSLSGSNESNTSDASVNNLQAFEDYNTSVWQNPAISVSYAPFTVKTPEPEMTYLPTAQASGTPSPTPMSTAGIGGWMNTATPVSPVTMAPTEPEKEKETAGSSALGIGLILGAAALAGGGIYLYSIHRRNERRRRAVREQQARKNARKDQYRQRPAERESEASPYVRPNAWQEQPSARPYPPEENGMDVRSGAVPQGTIRVTRDSRGTPDERADGNTRMVYPAGKNTGETDGGETSRWRKPAGTAPVKSAAGEPSRVTEQGIKADPDPEEGYTRIGFRKEEDPYAYMRDGSTRKVSPIPPAVQQEYAVQTRGPEAPQEESSSAGQTQVRRRRSERHRTDAGDEG